MFLTGRWCGHLASILSRIQPAVGTAKTEKGAPLDLSVNVRNMVSQLSNSDPILAAKVKSGDINIVGAVYDLDTATVELLK